MFAGSQLDMCVGLDIHMEMVPMPAPVPTPFPMPFVGQVEFSAVGVLMSMGIGKAMSFVTSSPPTGPVLVNDFQSVKTGDEAKNKETLPHIVIPPGTMWTPLPKPLKLKISPPPPAPDNPAAPAGDAVFITGSKTVQFERSSACRLGTLAMSCSDPVRLPSSVLMSVPKGLPVLVGGPDAIDWMAAAKAFFLRNKWTAGLLHQLVSLLPPGRFQNLLAKGVCMLTGHPVDVATGRLLTWSEDTVLRGPIPLSFERNYSSGWAERTSPCGHGWSHSFDERVWVERGRVVYLTPDGRELEFHTHELPGRRMRPGQELFYPLDRLTLRCEAEGRWTIRSNDGLVREFERVAGTSQAASRIARIGDRHGHSVRFVYEGGLLSRVETSEGRIARLEHRDGHLLRVMVQAGVEETDGWYDQVRFAYSASGDLISATDSTGRSRTYRYENHLLIEERDRDGVTFWFVYDGCDSTAACVTTWGNDGLTTDRLFYRHLSYDRNARRTAVEDSLGRVVFYVMNEANAVIEVIDPHGGKRTFEYDEHLWKIAETDPLGATTRSEYDARGNETLREQPDGAAVRVAYNNDDQPVRMTDLLGAEWEWVYDSRGRLVLRRNSAGESTRFEYEGRVLRRIVRTDDRAYTHEYDEAENLRRLVFADGTAEERWHDRQGRLIKTRDALGRARRLVHDGEGRVVLSEEPGKIWRQRTYSGEGDVLEYRDNLRHFTFGYSGYHQLAWREEAGDKVQYRYSSEDELTLVVNEVGEGCAFTRDACGRIVGERGFDGRRHSFVRDLAGRVTTITKPSTKQQKLEYDARGRLSSIEYADGSRTAYAYDAVGNLVQAENGTGAVRWARDSRGRAVRETFADDWFESAYDSLGQRSELRSSRGFIEKITRSPMGAATRVGIWETRDDKSLRSTWAVDFQRDALGREVSRRMPGNAVATWTYDERGLPHVHAVSRGEDVLARTEYTWKGDDRLSRRADAGMGVTQYVHDHRGRLHSAQYPSGETQYRAPGPSGNLFKRLDRKDRRYGAGGVLLEMEGHRFTYDADGNRIRKEGPDGSVWEYSWDCAGSLRHVRRPDGTEVTFAYDALSRRVERAVLPATTDGARRSTVTKWRWDREVPVHEWSEGADGGSGVSWVFEPGTLSPIGRIDVDSAGAANDARSIVTDYLGTPEEMIDEAGRLAWQAQVDIYGVARQRAGAVEQCPWRWLGQEADDHVDTSYNRYRFYDPASGQYARQDPIRTRGGLGLYSYAGDPLVESDPYGLDPCHHIATDKNDISDARGGPWTPRFRPIFANADMNISTDPANLVEIAGHVGPHPEAYHREVLDRLLAATAGETPHTPEYTAAVKEALTGLKTDLLQPGSVLNKLITRT